MTDEQKRELFETVELPSLIKNESVPIINFIDPLTQTSRVMFRRGDREVLMHACVYNILHKRNLLSDVLRYFAKDTSVEQLVLFDDEKRVPIKLNKS